MTLFVTNIAKHLEIKTEILDIVNAVDYTNMIVPHAIDIEHSKIQNWYAEAFEQFRLHQIDNGFSSPIFDPFLIWINVYPPGTSMNAHAHPGYRYYSIHYLQKTVDHSHTQMSDDNEIWTDPEATEGDIIFFSGDTYHRVLENTTNTLRVTIGMSASSTYMEVEELFNLREERNKKIAETDWWVMNDIPESTDRLEYRQGLRDITLKYNSLKNVVWPTKPQ